MQIQVNRGTVVDASTIEEALELTKPTTGITVFVNASPRPELAPQPQPTHLPGPSGPAGPPK